jgi:hypothetical protein
VKAGAAGSKQDRGDAGTAEDGGVGPGSARMTSICEVTMIFSLPVTAGAILPLADQTPTSRNEIRDPLQVVDRDLADSAAEPGGSGGHAHRAMLR